MQDALVKELTKLLEEVSDYELKKNEQLRFKTNELKNP